MSREPKAWIETKVLAAKNLTPSVRELTLQLDGSSSCPPGSHINVRILANGLPDHRSYSVVGADDQGVIRIAVKAQPESRGGSRYMWTLEPGSRVQVSSPVCNFALSRGAPHYLLLAGGIGITPLVAMAYELVARKASVRMLYAARSEEEFAYGQALAASLGERLVCLDASSGNQLDIGAEIAALPADAELYMCGPIGLMDAVRSAWEAAGRPRSQLRYETFGSSGRFAAQPFVVRVPRLGIEVQVPESRSMLDALSDAGVAVLSDCRRGECGLCALDVIEVQAEIDHRDVFFSEHQHQQNRRICACVSRAVGGTITIDPAFRGDPDLSVPEVQLQSTVS